MLLYSIGLAKAFGGFNNFEGEITSCHIKKCKTTSLHATVSPSHGQPLFPMLDTATYHANFQSFYQLLPLCRML
jgi:hypothetical protein